MFAVQQSLHLAVQSPTIADSFVSALKRGGEMYKVYGDYQSGNCYKIKLMLHLLNLPYE